jgi:F-type H+-transporting ATPase subunit b
MKKNCLTGTACRAPTILITILIPFHAASVYAGEHAAEAHAGPSWHFLFIILNFAILISLLIYFLKQKTKDQFKNRAEAIRHAIKQAKKLHDKTRWHLDEMKTKLKNSEAEALSLIDGVQKQANLEKQELLNEANEMTRRFSEDVKRITNQEVEQAKTELKAEAMRLATDLAAQKLEKEMTVEKQDLLTKEFSTKLTGNDK